MLVSNIEPKFKNLIFWAAQKGLSKILLPKEFMAMSLIEGSITNVRKIVAESEVVDLRRLWI